MNLKDITQVYFLGIGGIGMSAIARYFSAINVLVAGYDKTPTNLTNNLIEEGIALHFEDKGDEVLTLLPNRATTLVIYTPAVPKSLGEYLALEKAGYTIKKRAEVLGIIAAAYRALAVAGTHGKTTTSTMLAHVLRYARQSCTAFLGGISTNYNTNLLLGKNAPWMVVEADEFDRSFLQLRPYCSIITSYDADHLDIYKDADALKSAFQDYANLISSKGWLVIHHSLELNSPCKQITYGVNVDTADYIGFNLGQNNGYFTMDIRTPTGLWNDVVLGVPGIHNAENALAVIALAENIGLSELSIRAGLTSFLGVKRRFEYQIKSDNLIFIDDYAHHPTAISQLVASVRLIHPNKKTVGIFQPHLFSRTADFMEAFGEALSKLDEVILLPIYPAREAPMPGVTSESLLKCITNKNKRVLQKEEVVDYFKGFEGVLLTIGAGDIDQLVGPLKLSLT